MKGLLVGIIFILNITIVNAESYDERFKQLQGKSPEQAKELFSKWEKANPKSADVLLLKSTFLFSHSRKEDAKPDPKKAANAVPLKASYDTKKAMAAIKILETAKRKHANRLDIYFGLAFMYQELDKFDLQYKSLETAVKMVKKSPGKLLWKDNKKPEKVLKLVPVLLMDYMSNYQAIPGKKSDQRFLKLGNLTVKNFPKNVEPLNTIAGFYYGKKDWGNALTYLKKAHTLNKKDCVVLGNLANVYEAQKDLTNAKTHLNSIVKTCKNPEVVKQAKLSLKNLDQESNGAKSESKNK